MVFRRRKPTPGELVEELERCRRCGATVERYERVCPSCGSALVEEKIAILGALRDLGAMTASAVEVAVGLVGADSAGITPAAPLIRKQIHEIQLSDLHDFPVWEFALDEEGLEGQDEETVRPRPDLGRVDPRDGLFVVRAEFHAADGTGFDGFAFAHEDPPHVQPTIVTDERHVRFWFGIVAPGPAVLDASYRALGKAPRQLFPLRYRAVVDTADGDVAGTIDGFMHYAAGSTREIVWIT